LIERLRLENFKAFRQLDLALSPLTLLSGVNAAGKSTTIQALALLRQSHDVGVLDAEGGLLLNGDLVELGVGQDVLHEDYSAEPGDEHPFISIGLQANGEDAIWRAEYDRSRDRESDLLKLVKRHEPIPTAAIFGPGFQYLRADRIVPSVHYPKSYEVADSPSIDSDHQPDQLAASSATPPSAAGPALHRHG
jgi:predicted ATPase